MAEKRSQIGGEDRWVMSSDDDDDDDDDAGWKKMNDGKII